MKILKKARLCFLTTIIFSWIASGCQSAKVQNNIVHDFSDIQLEWESISPDAPIWKSEYSKQGLLIHCVKIDLNSPSLKIKMLPQSEESTKSVYAKKFAKENSLALTFNTTPFISKKPFQKQTPAGIGINNKNLVSKPLSSYCALAFFTDNQNENSFTAKIFSSQSDDEIQNAVFAAGGFWQILKNGEIIQFKEIRDSRTVCALDKTGKTLIVLAVEGEKQNKSSGLTYMECAEFLKSLGAQNAMEFDGGASTQLVINGKSILTYKNKVKIPAVLGFGF